MEVKPLVGNAEASRTLMTQREGSRQPASIVGAGGTITHICSEALSVSAHQLERAI